MCLKPIYILNPTLKKIRTTGEVDPSKTRKYKGFKIRSVYVDKRDGKQKVMTYDNCTDLSPYDVKFRFDYEGCLKGRYLPTYIKVPCGKCYECVKQKTNQMVARMYLEQKKHSDFGFFVTLTYDDAHLPFALCDDGSLLPTLNKKDVQDFLKRLRINLTRKGVDISDFKYFYIGEYGMTNTDNKRPHYHMCVFFDVLPVNEFYDFVSLAWKNGNIKVDIVNDARLRYCANSHATANKLFPVSDGVCRPFSQWSKGFGIPSPSDEKYIRNNMRVMIGECQYPVDGYLRSKCFTPGEINEKRKLSALYPSEDDVYKKLIGVMHRLYPGCRDIEDLTIEQFNNCKSQLDEVNKVKSAQFYKRYVLKRK